MLLIKGKTITGKTVTFQNVISLRYDADRYIPCDALELTVALQYQGEEFCGITAFLEGELFFDGIVDRQTLRLCARGQVLTLECRNKTAVMLDNEIKPYFYFQLTSEQLLERYALPFGIKGADFPYAAKQNFIQIKKGSSHWTMIEEYCRLVYQKRPYLTRKNIITLNPVNQTFHQLSNTQRGAVRYIEAAVRHLNDKILSKLYMKTATENYGSYYGVAFTNPNAARKQIRRERYYHPTNKVTAYKELETKQILAASNRDSFLLEVTLSGLYKADIGNRVRFFEEVLQYDDLYISGMSYEASPTAGTLTRLILRERQYV